MKATPRFALSQPPTAWKRLGLVIERGQPGSFDSSVTGDPCVVWDSGQGCYRMFYFGQKHVDNQEVNVNAHALGRFGPALPPNSWQKLGPIEYANPDDLLGDAHKPWVVMDPYWPHMPVQIAGDYWLFTTVWHRKIKRIQVATSASLAGPWKVRPDPVLDLGQEGEFDSYHTDTVTAYWFEQRQQILLFYKGYPRHPLPDQPHSPYGSSSAAAAMCADDKKAQKLGKVISPGPADHWLAGWVGGLQLFPAAKGGWYGLINGSPTSPDPVDVEPDMREPAPSLGGWAYTPEDWPVRGWEADSSPIEWIEDIPAEARANGEGVNVWRHHGFVTSEGTMYLLYNSGPYGKERMFMRSALRSNIIMPFSR
jgi:hypothetical protein